VTGSSLPEFEFITSIVDAKERYQLGQQDNLFKATDVITFNLFKISLLGMPVKIDKILVLVKR